METRCRDVRPLLEDFVDGNLEAATVTRIRTHLAGCVDCRGQHEEAVSIPVRMRALRAPEPPAELLPAVLAAVAAVDAHEGQRGRIFWKPVLGEVLLSAVIGWYISGFAGLGAVTNATFGELGQLLGWTSGSTALPPAPSADLVVVLACLSLIAVTTYHLMLIARSNGRRRRSRTA